MPTFEITAPDGKKYHVTGDNAEGAHAALKKFEGTQLAESGPKPKPIFTIETPSGRKLTIEAPDEATAVRGAQEWETQNSAPGPKLKPVTDPAILQQLNAPGYGEKPKQNLVPVTDPAILQQLSTPAPAPPSQRKIYRYISMR